LAVVSFIKKGKVLLERKLMITAAGVGRGVWLILFLKAQVLRRLVTWIDIIVV